MENSGKMLRRIFDCSHSEVCNIRKKIIFCIMSLFRLWLVPLFLHVKNTEVKIKRSFIIMSTFIFFLRDRKGYHREPRVLACLNSASSMVTIHEIHYRKINSWEEPRPSPTAGPSCWVYRGLSSSLGSVTLMRKVEQLTRNENTQKMVLLPA